MKKTLLLIALLFANLSVHSEPIIDFNSVIYHIILPDKSTVKKNGFCYC